MSLILGKPSGGQHTHLYEENGDGRSLCLRAPATFVIGSLALSDVTCANCKRIFDIMKRWNSTYEAEPIQINLPKKKKASTVRRTATGTRKYSSKRSGGPPRKKRSKKGE